jgi:hypothetical protein
METLAQGSRPGRDSSHPAQKVEPSGHPNRKGMMRRIVVALALAVGFLSAAAAQADPVPPGVLAPVETLIAGINAGDVAKIASAYSVQPTIVDEFAPFQWQGVAAAQKWAKDFHTLVASNGITQVAVSRRAPTYFHRAGHFAYLTVPMMFAYRVKGVPVSEHGAFVLSLYEMEGIGWKIRASTWYLINNSTEPPLGAGLK